MTQITRHTYEGIQAFGAARRAARWRALSNALLGRNERLTPFADIKRGEGSRYQGIQEIPAQAIVGSVGRDRDFDRRFRPLRQHLQDRWVRAYVTAQTNGWAPVRLWQVGDQYFVEDGHHRVSVARQLGVDRIEAEVWTYPEEVEPEPEPPATSVCIAPRCLTQGGTVAAERSPSSPAAGSRAAPGPGLGGPPGCDPARPAWRGCC